MARTDQNAPAGERSALLSPAAYASDSAVYGLERALLAADYLFAGLTRRKWRRAGSAHHRTVFYGPGTHYATTLSSDEADDEPEAEASDSDADDEHLGLAPAGFRTAGAVTVPRVTWRGKLKKSVSGV